MIHNRNYKKTRIETKITQTIFNSALKNKTKIIYEGKLDAIFQTR